MVDEEDKVMSTIVGFDGGLNLRDCFHGKKGCVVCGFVGGISHTHIMPKGGWPEAMARRVKSISFKWLLTKWNDLKAHGHVPATAKKDWWRDPRTGLSLCPNHGACLQGYGCFVRFVPEVCASSK
jgi:hypothetical protein